MLPPEAACGGYYRQAGGGSVGSLAGSGGLLRFCMITTFYPPHHFGGDGVAVRRLSHGLVRRGHEVEVVCDVDAWRALADGPEPEPVAEPPGLTVHRLRSPFGVLGALATQQLGVPTSHRRALQRIVDGGRFDVINFHNISLIGGPGVLALGGRRPVKLYTAHEHWLVCANHVLWRHGREACPERECLRCVLHARRPPQLWRRGGVVTRGLEHVDAFLAISEFSRRKHAQFGFPREMTVLPYGLPDRDTASSAPATVGPDEPAHPRPFFLFVGRLERIKGLDDVIPAMSSYPNADLVIAGRGEHEDSLRQLAEGRDNVRFFGWVDPERLRTLYRDCVALVVPSVCFETFGVIVAEAFREGTPVLVRDIGPLPELVETAGGGAVFSDPAGLLRAMAQLQADPSRRAALGAAARAAWEERWSEEAVLPRYLDIVETHRARRGPPVSAP